MNHNKFIAKIRAFVWSLTMRPELNMIQMTFKEYNEEDEKTKTQGKSRLKEVGIRQ